VEVEVVVVELVLPLRPPETEQEEEVVVVGLEPNRRFSWRCTRKVPSASPSVAEVLEE